jgi:hypothetical protein
LKPVLLVIAGPNGAGKTTVTARLREERWSEGVEYLNPDEVARDRFGDWNSPAAVLKAAIWTTERREELLAARAGMAFETVMSTDEKIDFIARAKDAGYSAGCSSSPPPIHGSTRLASPGASSPEGMRSPSKRSSPDMLARSPISHPR